MVRAVGVPTRYRRYGSRGDTGHTLFGSIGWLFADLMLALALAFLLSTLVGTKTPAAAPKPHTKVTSTPTPTPTPSPTKTTQPGPALDLHDVPVTLSIDPSNVSASAIAQQLLSDPSLKGRRAGLVILFGGGSLDGPWQQLDTQIWGILQSMDDVSPLFSGAVPLEYWNGNYPLNQFLLRIYLFKTSLRVLPPVAVPGPGKPTPRPGTGARILAAGRAVGSWCRPGCRGRIGRGFRGHLGDRPDARGYP
jgi:hypothetical protein